MGDQESTNHGPTTTGRGPMLHRRGRSVQGRQARTRHLQCLVLVEGQRRCWRGVLDSRRRCDRDLRICLHQHRRRADAGGDADCPCPSQICQPTMRARSGCYIDLPGLPWLLEPTFESSTSLARNVGVGIAAGWALPSKPRVLPAAVYTRLQRRGRSLGQHQDLHVQCLNDLFLWLQNEVDVARDAENTIASFAKSLALTALPYRG